MKLPAASSKLSPSAISLLLFGLVLASPKPADATEDLRFGVALGIVGQLPLGDDTSQPGAEANEFETALALHAEVLTFDIGQHVQLVPFFRATVAGGGNSDAYEGVFGESVDLVGSPETRMAYFGLGTRLFPVIWHTDDGGSVRPFGSFYVGYSVARALYVVALPAGAEDLGFGSGTSEVWRHTGLGLTLGGGVRWDLPVDLLGEDVLVPIIAEVQWTKNIWLDLERNGDRGFDESLLAPEDMNLDALSATLGIGLMF